MLRVLPSILAVVPANLPLATQEIVSLTKKADVKGVRAIGVLTKPDLAIEEHTQKNAIGCCVMESDLSLGYYMLRNRGPNDNMTAAQGRALEDSFFSQAPWSEVKRFHKAGMRELRIKVLNLFLCHTDLSWYDIRNEVTRQLYNLESLRVSLGNSRSRRQHFFALAETFQKTANSHVSEFKEPQAN